MRLVFGRMTNKLPGWLLLGVALAGCTPSAGRAPAGFQGVVEFEERSVSFEVGGRLRALAAARGETVEAARPVAWLDESAVTPGRDARQAEVDAARARVALLRAGARPSDVRVAQAQARAAAAVQATLHTSLARARALADAGSAPTAQVDELQGQYDRATAERAAAEERANSLRLGARPQEVTAAQAQLRAAEHGLAAEGQRLARYTARTPIAGTVLDVLAEPGDVVAPGAPVLTLADTARPYVDVSVPQARVASVRPGAAATVRIDGLSGPLPARVEDIGRRTEFTPRYLFSDGERPNLVVRVRLRVDDPQHRLRAGIPAFATIEGVQP